MNDMVDGTYTTFFKFMHWVTGLLIIGLLGVGLFMVDMPDSDQKWFVYAMHKATGLVVFVLAVIWVTRRVAFGSPGSLKSLPAWQRKLAKIVHSTLYVFMVLFPTSGLLMSLFGNHPVDFYGLFTIPAVAKPPNMVASISHTMHTSLPFVLMGIIGLHIIASLYHHFIRKDKTLRRMM